MRVQILAGLLFGSLALMPTTVSSHPLSKKTQQAPNSTKSGSGENSAKEKLPYPNVPRITAEEVDRLVKTKGNVVIVDTDDSMTYGAEHIKGAVNITYDPAADITSEDQMLGVLPGDKLIVFYCNCPHEEDSAPMVQEMWQLGYARDKVKALQGGLTRWEQLGYPLAGTDLPKGAQEKGD